MQFDVFTLFPGVIQPYLDSSILQRAQENQLIKVNLHNIRDWTTDKHHVTDDTPYGGGGGMVMKAPPIFTAVEAVLGAPPSCPLILMSPQGRPFSTAIARELAALPQIAILCGRYEGVDERIHQHYVDHEISIGDYVLSGGELAAMVIVDSVTRLIPGVLGSDESALTDSFGDGLLEYPQYTRPPEFNGLPVPAPLLSGNHAEIAKWRREQALKRTAERRPDLLNQADLTDKDRLFLRSLGVFDVS